MAKYKDIGGTTVGFRSGSEEYTYPSGFEGSIYYNSSNGQFEFVGLGTGVWSSGGNLNGSKEENIAGGAGTQTAALVSGGYKTGTPTGKTAEVESYNGTSWTEVADINTLRGGLFSDGTNTAAWIAGGTSGPGAYVTNSETWNGSSWTEVNEINTARAFGGATCGRSSTAGIIYGGFPPNYAVVESWDGTNWTEVGDLNSARRKVNGFGTATAAFAVGAAPTPGNPGLTDRVESWNGSSWTETTEINSGRGGLGGGGTTTDGVVFGSEQTPRSLTEAWNGTSWTEVADMATNVGNAAGSGGTGSSAWIAGGTDGTGAVATTEEWSFSHSIKTVTTS